MNPRRWLWTLWTVAAALLLAGCLGDTKYQKVTFSSAPRGATVYVDGQAIGTTGPTPIEKKLEREKDHTVVFEKDGYYPSSRNILSKPSAFVEGRRSPLELLLAPSAPQAVLQPQNIYTQLMRDPDWRPAPRSQPEARAPDAVEPDASTPEQPGFEPEAPPPTKGERVRALLDRLKRGEITSAEFEDGKNRILHE